MIHKKILLLTFLFILSISLIGCGASGSVTNSSVVQQPTPPKAVSPKADWNFLVYLDGDNDLEDAAINNFSQMEQVGSTSKVNILVLFARSPQYDDSHGNWSNTRLYRVTKNNTNPNTFTSIYLADFGQAYMSDPANLTKFITWCNQWFPAGHTALTLWDHGAGVWPRSLQRNVPAKGICIDSSGNIMTTDQVEQALINASNITGQKIDIVNMDACLMQLLEIAYQLRTAANYLVASEETVPWSGNDYTTVLTELSSNSGISPQAFASYLVDDYYNYYKSNFQGTSTTYSALDLSQVSNFVSNYFKPFAAQLNSAPVAASIYQAGTNATYFGYDTDPNSSWDELIDLQDLAAKLSTSGNIVTAATNLINAIPNLVINHKETGRFIGITPAHGLAINLPYNSNTSSRYSGSNQYVLLDLAKDTDWYSFIQKFAAYSPPLSSKPNPGQ